MFLMSPKHRAIGLGLLAALLLAILCAWHLRIPSPEEASTPAAEYRIRSTPSSSTKSAASPPSSRPAAVFRIAPDGMVDVPIRFQLPGVARVRSAGSFKEWLSQYPLDQQQKIADFNKKHFGVYMVNAPEQVAWMAQNGYPLPEDIIAAESMTDGNLRELAKHGNDKAAFILRERNIVAIKEGIDAHIAQGKTQEDFWTRDPEAWRLAEDEKITKQIIDQSNSPYKGYVQAQEHALQTDPLAVDSTVIAGLLWASRLGDFRASQFVDEYVEGAPLRRAMLVAARAVNTNDAIDFGKMQSQGCQRIGTPPGMFIPGAFAPVD